MGRFRGPHAFLGAQILAHSATGAFAARYRRVRQHRGHKKAVVAVAHAMLVTTYHLLARNTSYHDPARTTTTGATPNVRAAAPSKRSNAKATV